MMTGDRSTEKTERHGGGQPASTVLSSMPTSLQALKTEGHDMGTQELTHSPLKVLTAKALEL